MPEAGSQEPWESRRGWRQFSLKWTMLTITALCVWLGAPVERAHRQREAISMVESVGGWIKCESDGALYDVTRSLPVCSGCGNDGGSLGPQTAVVRLWAPLSRPFRIVLGDEFWPAITYVDVSDSVWIPNHFGIVSLQLEHVRWSTASERFEVCTPRRLRQILVRLVDAPRLSTLRLDSTCATDCDMPIVAQIGQLEVLGFQNTSISDTGLKCFSGLRKLRELYLYDSKVTRRGVDALRLSLPDCQVCWVPAKSERRLVRRRQP